MLSWIDGEPGDSVPVLDRGLHYGDGLFESMVVIGGQIRFIELHLERLFDGIQRLTLPPPDRDHVRAQWQRAASALGDGILKALLTRGDGLRRGYAPQLANKARQVLLGFAEPTATPAEPIGLWQCQLRAGDHPALAGLKTLNRLEQVMMAGEWQEAARRLDIALHEGLVCGADGRIIGGTSSNVFWRVGSVWHTPAVDRSGIAGVVRAVVLREAPRLGFAVIVENFEIDALLQAEEIVMTNARWLLRPVAAVYDVAGRAQKICSAPSAAARTLSQHLAGLRA